MTIPNSSGSVTIAPGGDLVVTGVFLRGGSFDGTFATTSTCFVGRYQAFTHLLEWGYLLPTSTCAASAVDSLGDVYVAGDYNDNGDYTGPADIYGQTVTGRGVFVARLDGPTGQPLWTRFIANSGASIDHLTTYGSGQLFVSGTYGYFGQGVTFGPGITLTPPASTTPPDYVTYAFLASFDPHTGAPIWARQLKVNGFDANSGGSVDSIAATGNSVTVTLTCNECDLGGGIVDYMQGLYGGLVAGYDSHRGSYLWSEAVSSLSNYAKPLTLTADPDGNVDFAGTGYPSIVLDKPNDNYTGTTISPTSDQTGGMEITGTISPATGAIDNAISTGGDGGDFNPTVTFERALTADTNGNLYTAGSFVDGTWQYGHYLPGDTTTIPGDGFVSG